MTTALPSRTFIPLNPRVLRGNICSDWFVCCLSHPSPQPGFRSKQNLLQEGKIGFSVFSIYVWSSDFPASPPLIAVELHFTEKWNFLILSWIFHLPCVGGLAEPVFWISLHPNNRCCPVLQISCFEHWKNRTRSWKKMEELKLTKVSQPEPGLETKCTKNFPDGFPCAQGIAKVDFLPLLMPCLHGFWQNENSVCIPCMMIKRYFFFFMITPYMTILS